MPAEPEKETNVLTVANILQTITHSAALPGVNASGTTGLNDNGLREAVSSAITNENLVWGTEGDFAYLDLHPSHGGTSRIRPTVLPISL
jgi:hypothetical protein